MDQNLNAPDKDATISLPLSVPLAPPPNNRDPLAEVPPHLWAVYLAQDVVLYSREGRPNLVRRFFLWAFFGWRWERIKRDSK